MRLDISQQILETNDLQENDSDSENVVLNFILNELQRITFKDKDLSRRFVSLIENKENRKIIESQTYSDEDEKFLTPEGSPRSDKEAPESKFTPVSSEWTLSIEIFSSASQKKCKTGYSMTRFLINSRKGSVQKMTTLTSFIKLHKLL